MPQQPPQAITMQTEPSQAKTEPELADKPAAPQTWQDVVRQHMGEAFPNFLKFDFKKKEGYKHSIELSKEYGLYRQNYCGCEFSLSQREKE